MAFLGLSSFIHSQNEVRLVKEFGLGSDDGFSDEAEIIGTVENTIVIFDNDQVYISDGTSSGTKSLGLLGDNDPSILHTRAVLNGKLYFLSRPSNDYDLVEIDPETQEMKFILEGVDYLSNIVAYKDELYLEVEGPSISQQFAKVNVETGELSTIFNIDSFGGMRDIAIHNDLIYTIHWSAEKDGAYLASNDGTPGSLNEFYFFHDGNEFSSIRTINMTSAGSNLFFWYSNGADDYVLFVSDGTEAGTTELKSEFEKINFFDFNANRAIGTINNSIFFRAEVEGTSQNQLWMSDGTVAGTQRISLTDGTSDARFFTNYGDKLYFRALHTVGSFSDLAGMIVTDGTVSGTQKAWDVDEDPDLQHGEAWHLIEHKGLLYFDGNSSDFGSELYVSDGTLANTMRLSDISEGDNDGFTYNYRSAGENLFFFGDTPETGVELYVYGPVSLSTIDLSETLKISPNPASSFIEIDLGLEKGESYRILNINGIQMRQGTLDSNRINVNGLTTGAYILQIVNDDEIYSTKFVKE